MVDLTPQQQLVLEQQYRRYDTIERTGEHLDNKAATVLQAGGLVITLTGVVALPNVVHAAQPPLLVLLGIAFGFLLFLGMVVCSILAWRPVGHKQAGTDAWADILSLYLNKDTEQCFDQIISDLLTAGAKNMVANAGKARWATIAAWLLALQVTGILVLAVAAAYMPTI